MPLTYVYTRLRVSLAGLAVSALFEESDLGLESLSDTLTTIVTDRTLSEVYASTAVSDMVELCGLSESEISLREVLDDFHLLTKLVKEAISTPEFKCFGYLRAIHLELPNTLILEYYSGKSTPHAEAAELETAELSIRGRPLLHPSPIGTDHA